MRAALVALFAASAVLPVLPVLSAQDEPKAVAITGEVSIVFWVTDFDAEIAFWQKVLGAEPVYLLKNVGFGELRTPLAGVRIGIARGKRAGNAVVPTFAVADLDATLASLKAHAIEPLRPLTEMPGLCRLAAIADPSGNEVQFVQSLRMPDSPWHKVTFLAGRWRAEGDNGFQEEIWTPPHGDAMFGQSRLIRDDELRFFELLRIERRGDELFFIAMPVARSVTAFQLTASSPGSVTFSNPEHDFPKRIRYWLEQDGSLRAVADDGTAAGKQQKFHWQRVE